MPHRYYATGALFIGSIIVGIVCICIFSQSVEKPSWLIGIGITLISAVPFFLFAVFLGIRKTVKKNIGYKSPRGNRFSK